MLRGLFKLVLLLVVLVALGAVLLGWRGGDWFEDLTGGRPTGRIDAGRAREVGAVIGEKAASAAADAEVALAAGRLTAKIKAKMALDDLVRARAIDVDTLKGVVTLSGAVASEAERQRAVRLARETAGVTSVVDRLRVPTAERQ
jgi:hypothetical protein